MAGNTLVTVADINDVATAILADHGDTINLVRREDEPFTRQIGETYSMRIAERVVQTTGRVADAQALTSPFVSITINQQEHQAFNLTVQEKSLSIDRLTELRIMPRASQIASDIESDLHGFAYTQLYQSVGTPGTGINTFALLQAGNTVLTRAGNPKNDRFMIMNADGEAAIAEVLHDLATPNQQLAADALTQGMLKPTYQYRRGLFVSNAVRVHTNGAWGDSTPVMSGAGTSGATQVKTDGWASGAATIVIGDVFTIANVYSVHPETRVSTGNLQQFVVTANLGDTGGTMTISISPTIYSSGISQNVNALPADNAALTFIGTAGTQYAQNLVARPDFMALAMVDQDISEWGSNGAKSDYNGVRLATIKGVDTGNHQVLYRMDAIYGRAMVQLQAGVRHWV